MVSKFVWSALGSMRYNEKEVATFAITPSIPIDKKGHLWKKGEYGGGGFKKRWFTLKGNMLFYFKAPNEREAIGFIFLEGCVIESGKEAGMPHGIRLVFDGQGSRTYILCADTEEDQKAWITALQRSSYRYLRAQIASFIRMHPDLATAGDGGSQGQSSSSDGGTRLSLDAGQQFSTIHQTLASPRRARAATTSAAEAPAVPPLSMGRGFVQGTQGGRVMKSSSTPPPARGAGASGGSPSTQPQLQERPPIDEEDVAGMFEGDALSTASRQSLEEPALAGSDDALQENLSEAIEGHIATETSHTWSRAGFGGSMRNASVRSQAGGSVGSVPVRDDSWTCIEVSIGCLGLPLEREDKAPSTVAIVLISCAEDEWTEWARTEIVEDCASPDFEMSAVFGRADFQLLVPPAAGSAPGPLAGSSGSASLQFAHASQVFAAQSQSLPTASAAAASDTPLSLLQIPAAGMGLPPAVPLGGSFSASGAAVGGQPPGAQASEGRIPHRVRIEVRFVEGGDGSRLRPWYHADCLLEELAESDGVCMDLHNQDGKPCPPKISLTVVRTVGDSSCTGRRAAVIGRGSASKRNRKVRNAMDISRYRVPTIDGRKIVVEEQMEESRYALPVPVQLLRTLMTEDMPGVVELEEMGTLAGEYEILRRQLLEDRRQLLGAYRDGLSSLDAYRETTFKPSTAKKSKELQFVTTNCHGQRICVLTEKGTASYETVTLGAPAAHSLGFKKGGLKRLLSSTENGSLAGATAAALTRSPGVAVPGPSQCAAFYLRYRRCLVTDCVSTVERYCDAFANALLGLDVAAMQTVSFELHHSIMQLCEAWEDKTVEHSTRVALAAMPTAMEQMRTPAQCNKLSDGSQKLVQKVSGTGDESPDSPGVRNAVLVILGEIRENVAKISKEVLTVLSIALMQEVAQQPGVTELILRRDICFAQALSALVTCFSGSCAARLGNPLHPFWPRQIESIGYLAHFESLLSTIGDEQGMLEDMSVAVDDLCTVKFKFAAAASSGPTLPVTAGEWCAAVSGARGAIVVTLSLPADRFLQLTDALRRGRTVSVRAVLFTQGVNEAQTWANKMGDTTLQDTTNQQGFKMIESYCKEYFKFCFRVCVPGGYDVTQELRMLEILLSQLRMCTEPKKGKNVELLKLGEELARRMNGGRLTSCKSGKDRTSMAVTLEQCVILQQHHGMATSHLQVVLDAMRRDGTRRRNVAKNIGESMYAFNSLQIMTLPKLYRPPKGTFGSAQS
eukprot:Opistho-2@18590